jgi:hypothetical protein
MAKLSQSTGDNQVKHLVLTFLSTAVVCAVVSATPAAAQDTVTGAPAGQTPVTVKGYGNSSGDTGPSAPAIGSALSGLASAIGSAFSDPASAMAGPDRAHGARDPERGYGTHDVDGGYRGVP